VTKTCTRCHLSLPLDKFNARFDRPGTRSHCKDCCNASRRRWEKKNPVKKRSYFRTWYARAGKEYSRVRARSLRLKRFGLDEAQYAALLESQSGRCGICRGQPNGHGRFNLDHDHRTDSVRGLLCSNCNTAIGLLQEDLDRFRAAIEYLTCPGRRFPLEDFRREVAAALAR